jgi:hypothetical protein
MAGAGQGITAAPVEVWLAPVRVIRPSRLAKAVGVKRHSNARSLTGDHETASSVGQRQPQGKCFSWSINRAQAGSWTSNVIAQGRGQQPRGPEGRPRSTRGVARTHQVQPRRPAEQGGGCPGQLKDPRCCIVAFVACNACNAVQCMHCMQCGAMHAMRCNACNAVQCMQCGAMHALQCNASGFGWVQRCNDAMDLVQYRVTAGEFFTTEAQSHRENQQFE